MDEIIFVDIALGTFPNKKNRHGKAVPMRCLLLHEDGKTQTLDVRETECAHVLGGDVTFVGAIDTCSVVALGLRDPKDRMVNVHCKDPCLFDVPVMGPVLIVASDERGMEMDVEVGQVEFALKIRTMSEIAYGISRVCAPRSPPSDEVRRTGRACAWICLHVGHDALGVFAHWAFFEGRHATVAKFVHARRKKAQKSSVDCN